MDRVSRLFLILGFAVVLVAMVIDSVSASKCYQETATESTACGGLATGAYALGGDHWSQEEKLNDTDWVTHVYTNDAGGDIASFFFVNYSLPANVRNATRWQVKYGAAPYTQNITINALCFSQPNLQFKVISQKYSISPYYGVYGYCYNGTAWKILWSTESTSMASLDFYEEGMWWDDTNAPPVFAQTTTAISIYHSEELSVQFNASNTDSDNLTFSVNTSLVSINTSGYMNDSPTQAETGNYSIKVNVTDGFDVVNMTFTYEIIDRLPTFTQEVPNITIYHDQAFGVQLNATDADGDTIAWTDNSSLLAINSTGYMENGTLSYDNRGTYAVRAIINDSWATTASDFLLVVNTYPPVINSVDMTSMTVYVGTTINITANITDQDDNVSKVYYMLQKSDLTPVIGEMTYNSDDGLYHADRSDTSLQGDYYLLNIWANDSLNLLANTSYGTTEYVALIPVAATYSGGGGGGGDIEIIGNITYENVTFAIIPKAPLDVYFVTLPSAANTQTRRFIVHSNRILTGCSASIAGSSCRVFNETWVELAMEFDIDKEESLSIVKTSWIRLTGRGGEVYDFSYTVRAINLGGYYRSRDLSFIPSWLKNPTLFKLNGENVEGVRYITFMIPVTLIILLYSVADWWKKAIGAED